MSLNLNAIRMAFEPQRSLAFGSIVAGYTAVGTALAHPARQILLYNGTDALLQFSIDGVTNHFVMPAAGYLIDDITSNKSEGSKGLYMNKGSILYVKRIGVPSSGSVYFSVVYATDGY